MLDFQRKTLSSQSEEIELKVIIAHLIGVLVYIVVQFMESILSCEGTCTHLKIESVKCYQILISKKSYKR